MKFAQMATKKLQKLVNDPATSDEDKVAIQAIIDKRQAAAQAPADNGAALSPEEQAAIDAAEKEAAKQNSEAGENKETKPKAKREAKPKQSILQSAIGALHIMYVPWQRMAIYVTALNGSKKFQ